MSPRLALGSALRGGWSLIVPLAAVLLVTLVANTMFGFVLQRTTTLMLINLVIALSVFGFSGLSGVLSFGQLGFVAVGAYTCALLTIPAGLKATLFPDMPGFLDWILDVELGLWPAMLVAGAVAMALSLIVAPAIVRLAGLQAGIATLALLGIVYNVCLNWDEVTRGRSTMIGVPADVDLGSASAVACLALIAVWLFARSRFGLRLRASRDDEPAARAVGVRVAGERTLAWALSAFVAGVAGALYSHFITTFTPGDFYLEATFTIIAMVVVGGIRSIAGVVCGVLAVTAVTELLRRLQSGDLIGTTLPAGTQQVVLAAILLIILITRPNGLTGGREARLPRRLGRGR
jgi:branched-chain amino acid transport system permease protein